MSDPADSPLENILKQCAARAPQPWYPQDDGLGLRREKLDPLLDELRLGGLVRLTDWAQGKGQGYALTPAGAEALRSAYVLARLRRGEVPAPKPTKHEETPERASHTFRRLDTIRKAIESPARPVVTLTLLYLNLAVFIVGCFLSWQRLGSAEPFILGNGAASQILFDTGAISAPAIFPGQQWWRLLTCCFVHVGVIHLIVNMVTLWVFGRLLENLWGRGTYISLYLVSGLCASFAVVAFGKSAAGASGALWGMMASLGVWYFLNRKALNPAVLRAHSRQLSSIILMNVIITFVIPNISVEAHFGGGLAGLIAAFPADYARYHKGWRRYLALAALPFLVVAFFSFFLQTYAAPRYLELLGQAVSDAGKPYDRKGLRQLLRADAAGRRLNPETLSDIEKVQQEFQSVRRMRWFGLFGGTRLREKIDAGHQLLDVWQDLFDGLVRSTQSPAAWNQADEAALQERHKQLLPIIRRWNELDPRQ